MKREGLALCLVVACWLAACGGDSSGGNGSGGAGGSGGSAAGAGGGPGGTGPGGAGGTPFVANKLDILFVIDNSPSMADKQQVLRDVIPDLMTKLQSGGTFDDVHLGVITSSLGGHGADACSPAAGGTFNPTMDDGARLVARDVNGNPIPTYGNLGFLAWDPGQQGVPPGDPDANSVGQALQAMATGAGEQGCGFEAPLEAWYRFLVDPEPYGQIVRTECFPGDTSNGCATEDGIDDLLLSQRADFMRPDSVLMVIMVGDENDCSVIDDGQFFISVQLSQGSSQFHMPRPTSVCFQNPDDPCCQSCGQPSRPGCPDANSDPSCLTDGGFYSSFGGEDQLNLRCFDQKRRFGIDFLYPIGRYVSGLRDPLVRVKWNDQDPSTRVPNPIFSNLQGGSTPPRDQSMVRLGGLLGLPHQLIDATAPGDPPGTLRYMTADQIASTPGLWDQIVGACPGEEVSGDCCAPDGKITGEERCAIDQRQTRLPPGEPLMVESIAERSGAGISGGIAPSSAGPGANPINGHEWNIADNDDLQYACIFPLATQRDCSQVFASCDCSGPVVDTYRKPLCQDPTTGAFTSIQVAAKAYPTLRQLTVMKAFGSNSLLGSICARNVTDPSAPDFGYRPFIDSLRL